MSEEELATHCSNVQALVNDFFRALDDGRIEDIIALFADDGVWERQTGLLLVSDFRKELGKRSPDRVTRHLTSNFRLVEYESQRCRVGYCLTTYSGTRNPAGPIKLDGPTGVFDCDDIIIRAARGWKFERRSAWPIFLKSV